MTQACASQFLNAIVRPYSVPTRYKELITARNNEAFAELLKKEFPKAFKEYKQLKMAENNPWIIRVKGRDGNKRSVKVDSSFVTNLETGDEYNLTDWGWTKI